MPTRRPQRRSEDTVQAIETAARTLFGRHGFDAVGVDAIAEACGRTKGAVYHHYATKDAVFEAVFVTEQRRLATAIVDRATATDPVDVFLEGIGAYLDTIATDRDAARITLLDAPAVLGWAQWRSCDAGPFRGLISASLEAISAAGRLRAGVRPEHLVDPVLGAVTESALTIATADDPEQTALTVRAACIAVLEGLFDPPA